MFSQLISRVQVRKVSEAEASGVFMPEIEEEKLTKKEFITQGGEGEVWTGDYLGHGPVAIKIVKLVGQLRKRDRTQVSAAAICLLPSTRQVLI
jgi:hypothetical protein